MMNDIACGVTTGTPCLSEEEIERRVAQWEAAKSKYPSWDEAWKNLFPGAVKAPCPRAFFGCECMVDIGCAKCGSRPMPAEVAEKLGVKPIAPEKPAPEHDGCDGCKWYDKKENDEPCASCRGTLIGGDEKPDLWERK